MADYEGMTRSGLLNIVELDVAYGSSPVLKGVSMSLKAGSVAGIVGESGSGKSTLIYASLGILGKGGHVTAGKIQYEDRDLLKLPAEELRRLRGEEISLIAQNPMDSFHPIRKIGKELRLFVKAHGTVSYSEAEMEILRLMETFNLKDGKEILGKYAFELSGGMCQRTAIALAMVRKPKILFADEPTSALDVTVQKQVVEEMLRVREEAGTSILIVSHNMGVISYMADEIYVMYAGCVVEYGQTQEVIRHAVHPYTQKLLLVVPRMNQLLPRGIHAANREKTGVGCPYAKNCPDCGAGCREAIPEFRKVSGEHYVRCQKAK